MDREENMSSGWLKDVAMETLGSDDAFQASSNVGSDLFDQIYYQNTSLN